jgi:hypothetical protein
MKAGMRKERSLRGRLGERVDKNKKPSQFANYASAIVKQNCRRFGDVERAQLIPCHPENVGNRMARLAADNC